MLEKQGKQMAFQFHKGTIRTGVLGGVDGVLGDFNSIKVRLEPCTVSPVLVRLKISIP